MKGINGDRMDLAILLFVYIVHIEPIMTCDQHSGNPNTSTAILRITLMFAGSLIATGIAGCSHHSSPTTRFAPISCAPCSSSLQKIEYPDLDDPCLENGSLPVTERPMTISQFRDAQFWEISLEECVQQTLATSDVLQKLGGVVVNAPGQAQTVFDQAIIETSVGGVEAALSAFDAQFNSNFTYNRNERAFNNRFFGGGADQLTSNIANQTTGLSKQTAAGTTFTWRNIIDYNRNNSPINTFASVYDWVDQFEVRQPLMRGRGAAVNRIAGPNAQPGQYNGVLIARIRSDISLANFERAVRDLIFEVENNYWELYYAYRDLDTRLTARESARETWVNRKLRYENGVGRPDEEAQARQQYYSFQLQAQNALAGRVGGQLGLLGSERNLRRLMGLPANDGRILKPSSQPAIAPVVFDWEQAEFDALQRRVEIRGQKWAVRQRELELLAAKNLVKWRFDFVGQYAFRGFGDDLFGSRNRAANQVFPPTDPDANFKNTFGSAYGNLLDGNLSDYQLGLEMSGAIGNRAGYVAIRNAEVNLVREKAVLQEQQRQIILDLNAAYIEVDRAIEALRTSFNSRVAVQEELEPKRKRVEEGQEQVFFLLDAEQRAATAESAVYRSIADYNQALVRFTLASGGLLSRYNITLAEGPWSNEAEQQAIRKAKRFVSSGQAVGRDVSPVSVGEFNQWTPSTATAVSYGGATAEEKAQIIEGGVSPVQNPQEGTKPDPRDMPLPNDNKTQPSPLLESPNPADEQPSNSGSLSAIKSYFSRRR
jgi:outer membrane protein TolC